MDEPPQPAPEARQQDPQGEASTAAVVEADKAFVFGSTMASRPRTQVDVTVSTLECMSVWEVWEVCEVR